MDYLMKTIWPSKMTDRQSNQFKSLVCHIDSWQLKMVACQEKGTESI